MGSLDPRPYLLINQIQSYAWGARGEDAFIPRLLGIEPEPDTPYAELWMGAHPNAPSQVVVDGSQVSLRQLIAQYPREILGQAIAERFSGQLPFLFKVLSTAESLSIQAHPTKEQARLLHARDPEHYPDDNHKPELAVALDSLTALMGIKPFSGILETLERYPELADFVGREIASRVKSAARADPQHQKARLQELYAKLVKRSVAHKEELVQKRILQYLEKDIQQHWKIACDFVMDYGSEGTEGLQTRLDKNLVSLETTHKRSLRMIRKQTNIKSEYFFIEFYCYKKFPYFNFK